jgi:hypothetical protein
LLIGAPFSEDGRGRFYRLYGGGDYDRQYKLGDLERDGKSCIVKGESEGVWLGSAVTDIGPMADDDEVRYFGVSAVGYDESRGRTYVFRYTTPNSCPTLSNMNGEDIFTIDGEARGDNSGFALAAGNIRGGRKTALVIGARNHGPESGRVYAIFKPSGGPNHPDNFPWWTVLLGMGIAAPF